MLAVHAHIRSDSRLQREPTLTVIQLQAGDTEVGKHRIKMFTGFHSCLGDIGKGACAKFESSGKTCQTTGCERSRRPVTVDADNERTSCEESSAVTAHPERAVECTHPGAWPQVLDDGVEQHWDMQVGCGVVMVIHQAEMATAWVD